MDPFVVAKRAELIIADIYSVLARFFHKQPALRALFTLMVQEEHAHARHVERWAAAWKKKHGDRLPMVDIGHIAKLTAQAAAFCEELKLAEVIEPEAAIGLATSIEREFNNAHKAQARSEMGGLFIELAKLDDGHLGLLRRALAKIKGSETSSRLPAVPGKASKQRPSLRLVD